MIEKAIRIPYMGGAIELHPAYDFLDDKGEKVHTEPCIKVSGISRFPVKVPPDFILACAKTSKDVRFTSFVAELQKMEQAAAGGK